jgi:hypothetical protein
VPLVRLSSRGGSGLGYRAHRVGVHSLSRSCVTRGRGPSQGWGPEPRGLRA